MSRWVDYLKHNLGWIVPSAITAFSVLVAVFALWFGGEGVRSWWNPEKPHLTYSFERISYYPPPPLEIPIEALVPYADQLLAELKATGGGYTISKEAFDKAIKEMADMKKLLPYFGMRDITADPPPAEKWVTTPIQDRYSRPIAEFLKAFFEAAARRRWSSEREAVFYRLTVRNEGVRAADNVKLTIRQFPIEAVRVLTLEYLDPKDVSIDKKIGLVRAERIRSIEPKSSLKVLFWPGSGPEFLLFRSPEVSVTYANGVLAERRDVVRPSLDPDETLVLAPAREDRWYKKALGYAVYALAIFGLISLFRAWRRSRRRQ